MTWTLVIAVWGALVGTTSLAWNIYTALRDRGRLKVSAALGWVVSGPAGRRYVVRATDARLAGRTELGGPPQLIVSVVNHGRRPLTVATLGVRLASGKDLPEIVPNLPTELKEGEPVDLIVNELDGLVQRRILQVFVCDTLGRRWKVRRASLKALRAQLERLPGTSGNDETSGA